MDSIALEDAKRAVHYDSDSESWVYRMSSVGMCERALLGLRLGIEPYDWPDFVRRGMDEGSLHEEAVLKKMEEKGWRIRWGTRQLRGEIRVGKQAVIRGHIECLGEHRDHGLRVIEIKALSKAFWEKVEKKGWAEIPHYAQQLAGNMEAHDLPGFFIVKNRDNGKLLEWVVDEPPADFGDIKAKILSVEAAARKGTSPRKIECPVPEPYPCIMAHLHTLRKPEGLAASTTIDSFIPSAERVATINAMAATFKEAQERKVAAEAAYKEASEALLEILAETKTAQTDRYRVTRVEQRNRTRVDMKKLKEAIDVSVFEVPMPDVVYVKVTEVGSEHEGGEDS